MNQPLPKDRKDIAPRYRWDLTIIYPSNDAWEADYTTIRDGLEKLKGYAGTLHTSARTLADFLKQYAQLSARLDKVSVYASLFKDIDLRNSDGLHLYEKAHGLWTRFSEATAFMNPEIISLPDAFMKSFLKNPKYAEYKGFLTNILIMKPYTLTAGEEKILAAAGEATSIPYQTFSAMNNADIDFPTVKGPEGEKVQLSHAVYGASVYDQNRKYRERVHKAYYQYYMKFSRTLSVQIGGALKSHVFYAQSRGFESSLLAALYRNRISPDVYNLLLQASTEGAGVLHRWADMKRKKLGLKKLAPYDIYVPLYSDDATAGKEYTYENALKMVRESVKHLGDEYLRAFDLAVKNRRIDVYETPGKRSGAYSSGSAFGYEPFILLNWKNTLDDVFTLAHEIGHNIHSYFSGTTQPYLDADYTIFVAEVASTTNEALLLHYLLKRAKNKQQKMLYMEKYLNSMSSTFFRQVMFADFESQIHTAAENQEPKSAEDYCQLFTQTYHRYWGEAMELTKEEGYGWARIPHFYYNFYVYQYATGFAAAQHLAKGIVSKQPSATERYLEFLHSGSKHDSVTLLQKAGVDLTKMETYNAVFEKANEYMDYLEKE